LGNSQVARKKKKRMRTKRMSLRNLRNCLMRMAALTLIEKIQTREENLRMAKEKLSSVLLSLRRK
jgi:hypothetical protein